jgi:hypothetical protein
MELLKELQNFVSYFTRRRFPARATRVLVNKKEYLADLECAYMAGTLTLCEDIFKKNKNGNYQTKDDLMADIHLTYIAFYNQFHSDYGYKVTDRADINKPIMMSEPEALFV